MSRQNALVWFRNDFRSIDNPALYHACQSTQPVIAIYIATPQQWNQHDDAAVKLDFWRRNLVKLENELAKLNIQLHFFQVDSYPKIPDLIATICQQWAINQVHFNAELAVNECQRDTNVIERCQDIGVTYQSHHDQLLLPAASIRTKTGTPYKVFTPFSAQARQHLVTPPDLYPAPVPSKKATDYTAEVLKEQCQLADIPWPATELLACRSTTSLNSTKRILSAAHSKLQNRQGYSFFSRHQSAIPLSSQRNIIRRSMLARNFAL